MRILLVILLTPLLGFSQAAERSDTLPPIHTISTVCYKATMKGREIVLGERGWYKWFLDDSYVVQNRDGGYISSTTYEEDGTIDRITYFEDNSEGLLVKISTYSVVANDTTLSRYTTYYYDKDDFCYLDSSFEGNGELSLITKSAYDKKQRIEVNRTVYPDGKFLMCTVQYYDEFDRIIKTEDRSENNSIEREVFFYRDTINHTSEYYTLEDGDTTSHTMTQYNAKGLELFDKHFAENYSGGEHDYNFDYEYNDYGDWVKKLAFRDGKLEYCVVREITYYED